MRLAPHDAPDFLTLAAERLRPEPPHADEALANPRGDHSLDNVPLVHPLSPKPAAVLVPVVMREEPMLLLTERSAHLRQHSGQIAFPGGRVDPEDASVLAAACREAMEEIGVYMSEAFPKPLTDEVVRAADVVITMGCGDACPIYPGKRYEDWQLHDPAGQDVETVREIRDEIDARVLRLVADLLPD